MCIWRIYGHPLLGDSLYNPHSTNLIIRQALHSYETKFIHPVTKELLSLTAEIPEDMKALMCQWGRS